MLVITAGRTGPNKSVRFGGDASLDERGRRDVAALRTVVAGTGRQTRVGVAAGPERVVAESCAVLQVSPATSPDLRSLDVGTWAGRTPADIDPDELSAWFTDPGAHPHGGESVTRFVERIRRWYRTAGSDVDVCVVAMPVAQALLCGGPADFFDVEVRPATTYRVT